MSVSPRAVATAATVALFAATPLVPAQAAPTHDASAKSTYCNAKGYQTKIRNITTRQVGYATRVHTEATPGRTVYKAGETRSSSITTNTATAYHVEAEAKAEVGGKFPLVSAKVSARTGISYTSKNATTTSETTTITNESKTVIPKATSVAWFTGHVGTKGTAELSYCDALEGSGEGYVKWSTVRFSLYSADTGSGIQRCDVRAYDVVAQAAKRNCR